MVIVLKISDKFNFFLGLGYDSKNIIKMIRRCPNIICFDVLNLENKFNDLIELGFKKDDIISMTGECPNIFTYSTFSISGKIDGLVELGYSMEEVIKIIIGLPAVLGLSLDNLGEKINYLNDIGLHDVFVLNPKYLMQSVKLSYARYNFLKDSGILVTIDNYRKLFMGEKTFIKQYGISKDLLLDKYDYDNRSVNLVMNL